MLALWLPVCFWRFISKMFFSIKLHQLVKVWTRLQFSLSPSDVTKEQLTYFCCQLHFGSCSHTLTVVFKLRSSSGIMNTMLLSGDCRKYQCCRLLTGAINIFYSWRIKQSVSYYKSVKLQYYYISCILYCLYYISLVFSIRILKPSVGYTLWWVSCCSCLSNNPCWQTWGPAQRNCKISGESSSEVYNNEVIVQ